MDHFIQNSSNLNSVSDTQYNDTFNRMFTRMQVFDVSLLLTTVRSYMTTF